MGSEPAAAVEATTVADGGVPMMNLTLTYDHRLVDGALAGRFLRDLRGRLQSWGESDY